MSHNDTDALARLSGDLDEEPHATHAQGRQQQHPQGTSSVESHGQDSASSRYRDVGVQTLPPPNGEVYRLVHGCEPLATSFPQMGFAAIGRFTQDSRSNPYDVLSSATCAVSRPAHRRSYADSGFQTAAHHITNMAVIKAKAKASMMVNRYRRVANEAGYIVFAEVDDDMIVHSEQHPSTVRLNSEGNLVEGTTLGRYLPNIRGALSDQQSLISDWVEPVQMTELSFSLVQTQRSLLAFESVTCQTSQKISAFAPSSSEPDLASSTIIDEENGSLNLGTADFIVYDPEVVTEPPALDTAEVCEATTPKINIEELYNDGKLKDRSRSVFLKSVEEHSVTDTEESTVQTHTQLSQNPAPKNDNSAQRKLILSPRISRGLIQGTSVDSKRKSLADKTANMANTLRTTARAATKAGSTSPRRASSLKQPSRITKAKHRDGNPLTGQVRRVISAEAPSATEGVADMTSVERLDDRKRKSRAYGGEDATMTETYSLSKKRSWEQSCAHGEDDEPGAKRVQLSPQSSKRQLLSSVRGKSTLRASVSVTRIRKPDISAPQLSSAMLNGSNLAAPGPAKKQRVRRQPFAPYVPPALRAKRTKDS